MLASFYHPGVTHQSIGTSHIPTSPGRAAFWWLPTVGPSTLEGGKMWKVWKILGNPPRHCMLVGQQIRSGRTSHIYICVCIYIYVCAWLYVYIFNRHAQAQVLSETRQCSTGVVSLPQHSNESAEMMSYTNNCIVVIVNMIINIPITFHNFGPRSRIKNKGATKRSTSWWGPITAQVTQTTTTWTKKRKYMCAIITILRCISHIFLRKHNHTDTSIRFLEKTLGTPRSWGNFMIVPIQNAKPGGYPPFWSNTRKTCKTCIICILQMDIYIYIFIYIMCGCLYNYKLD